MANQRVKSDVSCSSVETHCVWPLIQPLGVAKPPRPLAQSESRFVIYPKVTNGGFEGGDRPVPLSLARSDARSCTAWIRRASFTSHIRSGPDGRATIQKERNASLTTVIRRRLFLVGDRGHRNTYRSYAITTLRSHRG